MFCCSWQSENLVSHIHTYIRNTGTPIALHPQHLPLLCVAPIASRLLATLPKAPPDSTPLIVVSTCFKKYFHSVVGAVRSDTIGGLEGMVDWLTRVLIKTFRTHRIRAASQCVLETQTPESGERLRMQRRSQTWTIGFVLLGPSVATCIC
jgi:hypothetical protein